jgi:superfamily I DNA/RNA helicase
MIADYSEIQASLTEEGEVIRPDISSDQMRHGSLPFIRKCNSAADELMFIKNTVGLLKQEGFQDHQIAVLARFRGDIEPLQLALRGYDVKVHPIHSFKGLEMEAVILPHLQKTFLRPGEEANERRLLYMAMSRARERLVLSYSGKLPRAYDSLITQNLVDHVV